MNEWIIKYKEKKCSLKSVAKAYHGMKEEKNWVLSNIIILFMDSLEGVERFSPDATLQWRFWVLGARFGAFWYIVQI